MECVADAPTDSGKSGAVGLRRTKTVFFLSAFYDYSTASFSFSPSD